MMQNYRNNLVDMHAHILPEVDHGSRSIEMSLDLIRHARDIGIHTIVASSHYYNHELEIGKFLEMRERAYIKLTTAMHDVGIDDVNIVKAAEVAMEFNLLDDSIAADDFRRLCIDGTDFLLLEMPLLSSLWSERTIEAIDEIEYRYKVRPIIAHIERYDRGYANVLIDQGRLCQMNADQFASFRGKRDAKKLIERNAVHFLGSDAHGVHGRTYDNFEKAIKKLDPQILEYFTENSHELLAGKLPAALEMSV